MFVWSLLHDLRDKNTEKELVFRDIWLRTEEKNQQKLFD